VAGLSDIEWTDATWNPVAGCLMISPGCTNCYAMRMAGRLQAMGLSSYGGVARKSGGRSVWTGKINLIERALDAPLSWRKPRKVFVNSMSDLFQDGVSEEYIQKVWSVMERANWHVYQILTKRPDNMRRVLQKLNLPRLPHVWLGTSVESAAYKTRIAELQATPASIRFVSFEPLLDDVGVVNLDGIHWAIVGGESGPKARPIEEKWVRRLQRTCKRQGVAFFFKQWGGTNKKSAGRELNGRTWDEFPRVRPAEVRGLSA
jgi:protein gp37